MPVKATPPAPAGAVKGVEVRRGSARIAAVRACPITSPVTLRVRGRQIRRVTFFVDGRRVASVTRASSAGLSPPGSTRGACASASTASAPGCSSAPAPARPAR